MKVCELYDHVAQLGFEDDLLEYDKHFVLTANRSLFEVAALRPQVGSVLIHHEPLENLIKDTFAPQKKIDEVIFSADGAKAFYFEVCGTGEVYVEWFNTTSGEWTNCYPGGQSKISFATGGSFAAFRGHFKYDGAFCTGEVRLRFAGDYVYSYRNVALYRNLMGALETDIPACEAYTAYDMSILANKFLSLCRPPIVDDGTHKYLTGGEYDIENDRIILLPYDQPGVYKIRYNRQPAKIEDDGDPAHNEADIDLDEDLCELLPLLIAAYVWADDEDAKAQYYLNNYNQQAAIIMAKARNTTPVRFRDTNGW